MSQISNAARYMTRRPIPTSTRIAAVWVKPSSHGDAASQTPQARTIHSSHSANSRIAPADKATITAPLTQASARAGPRASAITHGDSKSMAPKIST
jgi:hypothetical protein